MTDDRSTESNWLLRLESNFCTWCHNRIVLVSGVGWLHMYRISRDTQMKCEEAVPGAFYCAACGAMVKREADGKAAVHPNRISTLPCIGARDQVIAPKSIEDAIARLNG